MNLGSHSADLIEQHTTELERLRPIVEGQALFHPDEQVRTQLSALLVATHNTVHACRWIVSDDINNRPWTDTMRSAQEEHEKAKAALNEVAERLRQRKR